jgi:hypothetical protein
MILQGCMVFFAAYFNVMLLGFQSRLMRDNRWQLSMVMTILITLAQSATMWAVANNHLGMPVFLVLSCMGGSLGIGSSHFFYRAYDKWVSEKKRLDKNQ